MDNIIDILKKYNLWEDAQREYRLQKAYDISEKINIHIELLNNKRVEIDNMRRKLLLENHKESEIYNEYIKELSELYDWISRLKSGL